MNSLAQKASRILTLIPLVRQRPGIRVRDLARRLGVSPRVVLSDLDMVLMCGVPPYLPNDYVSVCIEGGRVWLDFADHFRRPIALTPLETLALRLALDAAPVGSRGAVASLRRKLRALMPSSSAEDVEGRFAVVGAPAALRARMETLERAVLERREVRLTYYTASRDETTQRVVRPYAMVEHDGHWYLVGHCLLRGRELPFRVDRIRDVALLDGTFEVPAGFDIEAYRRPEMYFPTRSDVEVIARIAGGDVGEPVPAGDGAGPLDAAPRLREIAREPDGSRIVSFRASRSEWVVFWALAHGDRIEILKPETLRRQIAQACADLLALYD